MRNRVLLWILLVISGMATFYGCGDKGAESNDACADLDLIFDQIDQVEHQLNENSFDKTKLTTTLSFLSTAIEKNMNLNEGECLFTNHKPHPDQSRFHFVEVLTGKIVEESYNEGIRFLLDLKLIFDQDKEITEFIAEDLETIASNSPDTYLDYYLNTQGSKEFLLTSTNWSAHNLENFIRDFRQLEGGDEIAEYLEKR